MFDYTGTVLYLSVFFASPLLALYAWRRKRVQWAYALAFLTLMTFFDVAARFGSPP